MDENKTVYKSQAEEIIKNLKKRNMNGMYFEKTEQTVARIKNCVAPRNAIRVNIDTPCSKKGFCQEPHCTPPHRICSQLVILESSTSPCLFLRFKN